MSDTRRRRKSNQSCGSDDLSDSYDELNATKETQSSEQTDGHQDSDCESYESEFDGESQEGAQRESGDGQEEEKPQKKLDDDEDRRNPQYIPKRGTFYEHDDRTADEVTDSTQETQNERDTKEKKVWKDKEDRWDHDRYNDEEQAPKSHEELIAVYGYDIRNEEGPPRARRRRRYGRGPNKYTRNWEDENAYGKSSTAVSSSRGNRRFNKNTEDFPALGSNKTNKNTSSHVEEPVISSAWYSNKSKSQSKVQNFPPLQSQENQKTKSSGSGSTTQTNENKAPNESVNQAWKKDAKHGPHNQSVNSNTSGPGGDTEKIVNVKPSPRDSIKKNVQESTNLTPGRFRGRGFKANMNNNVVSNRSVENKPKGRGAGPIVTENKRNSTVQQDDDLQATQDTKHSNVNDGSQYHSSGRHNKNYYGQSSNQQRTNTVPPRLQQQQSHQQQQQTHQQQQQQQQQQQNIQQDGTANRPKRYSSLRQRPTVLENTTQQSYPAQHTQHNQHAQHGQHAQHAQHAQHGQHTQHGQHSQHGQHNQHGQHGQRGYFSPQGYPQSHFEQSQVAAPAAPMTGQPVIPIPPSGQTASYAPPPFLVPPPQFMPPQTAPPSIINYVPGPNGPPFQPNFQGYQGYNPSVQPQGPPPPQELFQPQGCTYYSPAQQQQQQQQSAPLRRPKAAIPILPPPDNQQQQQQQQHTGRGRGKSNNTQQQQPSQQQTNSPGNSQQTEESKDNTAGESDSKSVPGQFDNANSSITQTEKSTSPQVENTDATSDTSMVEILATATTTTTTSTVTATTINTDTTNTANVVDTIETNDSNDIKNHTSNTKNSDETNDTISNESNITAINNIETTETVVEKHSAVLDNNKIEGTNITDLPEILTEKNDISKKLEDLTVAESETNKIESAISENSIVGEAAA